MIIHVDARRSQRLPLPILGGATPVRNCDALAIKVTVIARSQPAPGRGLLSRPREVSSGRFSTDLEIQHEGTWTALHEELHRSVTNAVLTIAAQFPSLQVWPLRCTGYKIQHYRRSPS
jgi:hypothetical protein